MLEVCMWPGLGHARKVFAQVWSCNFRFGLHPGRVRVCIPDCAQAQPREMHAAAISSTTVPACAFSYVFSVSAICAFSYVSLYLLSVPFPTSSLSLLSECGVNEAE
eukprot:1152869-Pelagomonas_calceolata.AAC.3